MNNRLVITVIFALVFIASYGVSNIASKDLVSPVNSNKASLEARIALLESTNEVLTEENNNLRFQLTNQITVPISKDEKPIEPTLTVQSTVDELEKYKVKAISNHLAHILDGDLGQVSDRLSSQFEDEAVDYDWAQKEEQKISASFSNHQELAGLALQGVSCRSTQCKLSVAINDINHANEVFSKIELVLKEKYPESVVFASPDFSKNISNFYISSNIDI